VASDDQRDWRLQAELSSPSGMLEQLVMHLRGPDAMREVKAGAGPDVVITHDGRQLFAYAASRSALDRARASIAATLRDREITASEKVSHWDPELDEWLQVEPPLTGTQARAAEHHRLAADAPDTRTLVADVGREVRAEFEQSLLNYASELGVECEIVEHPHLLNSQVAFHIRGTRRKLDEFAAGLNAEERATIRTERTVMLSPL
jgi:hypothetical protein